MNLSLFSGVILLCLLLEDVCGGLCFYLLISIFWSCVFRLIS